MKLIHRLVTIVLTCAAAIAPGQAAILYLEEFDTDAAGWTTRDGEMTVTHDNVNDWLVGSYGTSFLPQSDSFRIASGTDFLGDYTAGTTNHPLTQLRFDFYAVNVLPGDLFIRLIDGANTFTYQFNPTVVGGWQTFTVNLAWSFGWSGLSEASFNTALTGIDAVEVQLSRSGIGAQTYYLDNVETLNTELEGGGPALVPEPSTISLLLSALAVLSWDRRRRGKRDAGPCGG